MAPHVRGQPKLQLRAQSIFVTRWLGVRANRERYMLGLQFREVNGKEIRAVREGVREVSEVREGG